MMTLNRCFIPILCLVSTFMVVSDTLATLPPLHDALRKDDIGRFLRLIDEGADLEQQDEEQRTPLHMAVIRNQWPYVKALLKAGANPNATDTHNCTPLMYFLLYHKDASHLQLLLNAGADVNMKAGDRLSLPLREAVRRANLQLVSFLLARGALVEPPKYMLQCGKWGMNYHRTPLELAQQMARENILQAAEIIELMQNVKRIGANAYLQDLNAQLHRLIDELDQSRPATREQLTPIANILNRGAYVKARDESGRTPLMKAREQAGLMDLLMFYGANFVSPEQRRAMATERALRLKGVPSYLIEQIYRLQKE